MKAIAQAGNSYKNDDLYATDRDFCEVFKAEMTGLYSLSLLLTGSRVSAEQCFVAGLKDSVATHGVFKAQAHAWSRRSIIKNAIQMVRPSANAIGDTPKADPQVLKRALELHFSVAAIMGLEPFDRFVFVMSILEGYTLQDCATLLNSTRQDVSTACARALYQLTSNQASAVPAVRLEPAALDAQDSSRVSGAA